MFIKNFEGYKQATPEELEDAWRLDPGQGSKALLNIDKSIASAKVMAERWQYAKNKMKPVVNPANFPDNTPEKEMAEIYNEAYLTGLDNLVFMGGAYDNNAERLGKIYNKLASIPTIQNSRFSDIAAITDPARLSKEIAMLRTEVSLTKDATTPEAKEQHTKSKDLLEKLESYQKEQLGATVDFIQRVRKAQKEIMETEDISANEAQQKANEKVTAEYEKEGIEPFLNYKDSFKNLLDSLAGSEEAKINLDRQLDDVGGLDDVFDMLMDTHILRNENMYLNKYINILNSPADFYEHVRRNFEWMKKLYNNRQDHYDEVVNNSLTAIQRNTLLEELAETGIYVDLEEFAEWCEDKSKRPTYFIDQVNKRIINQDSYLYDQYIEKFEMAENAETTNPPKPKSTEEQKLEKTIENYNDQRDGELETVKNVYDNSLKQLIGYTQEEIEQMRNDALGNSEMTVDEAAEELALAKKALTQLDSFNHLEVQAVFDLAVEKEMFTAQEYNLAKEDLFSNEAAAEEVAFIAQKYVDAEEEEAVEAASNVMILKPLIEKRVAVLQAFVDGTGTEGIPSYEETQPYADYTKAVDEINTKYDDLIDTAKSDLEKSIKADIEANRPEAMKKSIQEVQELFAGKEDIVQTKRNYIIDGELHERMSNRIKTGYDTYGYSGEADLMEVYDNTIGTALEGTTTPVSDIEKRTTKIISSETVEKGNRKGQTRTVTQTNSIKDVEGTLVSVTEYEAKVEDTTVTLGGRRMTYKEFKEEFPLDEEYEEILGDSPDLNDNTIITVRKVQRTPTSSRFDSVVDISSPVLGEGMRVSIKKDDTKYDAELEALEDTEETTSPRELDQDMINEFMEALIAADLPGVNTNKYTVDIVRDELETLIKTDGTKSKKIQRYIDKLKTQLSDVENKLDSVTDKARLESLKKQKASLEEAIKDEETGKYDEPFEMTSDNIKSFILNTVKENAYEESRDAGNIIDPMLKDYLDTATSVKPKWDKSKMSKEAYDNLFDDETGYLTQIKRMADNGEIYIFTKDLIVHANDLVDENGNKLPKVAGEIDMIIVDRKGNKSIVDLKTGKIKKWFSYKTLGTDSYKKQLENTLQQTGYANLAENMSGQKFDIKIFPIEIGFDDNGYIISASKPTNPSLFIDEEVIGDEGSEAYTISLDKGNMITAKNEETGVYETQSIDSFMQKLIPVKGRKASQVQTQPTKKNNIPEDQQAIVDNFMARMAEIADTQQGNDALDSFTDLALELDEIKPTLSKEAYNNIKSELDARMSLTFDETGEVVLNIGEIYIFTQPVKDMKIPDGYRVKVDTFDADKQTVTISRVGPGRKSQPIEISIKDFNAYAMSEKLINEMPKEEEPYNPTAEEIEHITKSMTVTDEQLSDFAQLAKWEEEASSDDISLDQLKNDFFNNFKC